MNKQVMMAWALLIGMATSSDGLAQPAGQPTPARPQNPAAGQPTAPQTTPPRTTSPQTTLPQAPPQTGLPPTIPNTPPLSSSATRFVSAGPATSSATIAAFLSSPARRHSAFLPEMLGDFGIGGPRLAFADQTGAGADSIGLANLPVASGLNRLRIGEFNKAMPVDRIYASYNYYHNTGVQAAVLEDPGFLAADTVVANRLSVHRWTLGAESTFECGRSSIEFRLPVGFADYVDATAGPSPFARFGEGQGTVGNLSVILKRIGAVGECGVLSYGLGIEIPTGADGELVTGSSRFELGNDVVHLSPYVAILRHDCCRRWFTNGFLQVDVPLGGESFDIVDRTTETATVVGVYNDPVRLLGDLGFGRWLATNTPSGWSLAALAEVHLVSNLSDADGFGFSTPGAFGTVSGAVIDTADTVVNSTFGFHLANPDGWRARMGAAMPLTDRQLFDAELQVQVGRNF